ncbi:MAG TPA: flagellar hook-associated protein FlgL [Capsulimonadaceae bacterium]|jgi:flagellar hook-associated protein 3 FlgL
MRITEALMTENLISNTGSSSASYNNTLNQLSSGKRINQASDDPAGTAKALALQGMISDMDQYSRNSDSAKSFLQYSDSQLGSVTNLIQQARQVAVAAANGATGDSTTQAAYSAQVDAIINQITQLANSDINGRRLFSGTATNTDAFDASDATHAYKGNSGALNAQIAPGVSLQINTPGDSVFSGIFSSLEALKSDIQNGNYTSISNNGIAGMDSSLNAVLTTRATIGNKLNQVSDTADRIQTSQLSLQDQLSTVEDVDLATTYANLQLAQNVYQASLSATSKALQYSLVDYIK